MLTDIDKEFDTPIEDENGELIETIEEDDVFVEEDTGLEEQPDSFYEAEDDIVQEGEEEEEFDNIQEVTVEAKENYDNAKEQLVAIFSDILERGEITAEDNVEIEQLKEQYTQAYNDVKENTENVQKKTLEEQLEELKDGMVGATTDEILNILTDYGRKPWLYKNEDNDVLVDMTAIPELTVLVNKLNLIATDGENEGDFQLTPEFIKMIVGGTGSGDSINKIANKYYLSTSKTELVGGTWVDVLPTPSEQEDKLPQETEPICISAQDGADGQNGLNGADGVDGKDGTSIIWQGSKSSHPTSPQNGWAYYNSTDKKSYVYQSGAWYQMTVDGQDGLNGNNGKDGLSIEYKGELSSPPSNPVKNWTYKDSDNGIVYIYTGLAWEVMTYDGSNGQDGANGQNGLSIFVTYNDSATQPATPAGNGTTNGWHTNTTSSVVWMSQKVASSADAGTWGVPIKIQGKDGANGQNGVSVEEVINQYSKNTSTTTAPTTGWDSSMPSYQKGYYLWVRTRMKYSNSANYIYSTPICDQSWKATQETYTLFEQLRDKINLIVADNEDNSSIVLTPLLIQLISSSDIELSGKQVKITGDTIIDGLVTANDYFVINKDGSMTCKKANIIGSITATGNIVLYDNAKGFRGRDTDEVEITLAHVGNDNCSRFGWGSWSKASQKAYDMGCEYLGGKRAVIRSQEQTYLVCNGGTYDSIGGSALVFLMNSAGDYAFRPVVPDKDYLGTGKYYWAGVNAKVFNNTSDRNLKENVTYLSNAENIASDITIDDCYNFFKSDLPVATYNYINDESKKIGFIAQDVIYNSDETINKIGQLIVNMLPYNENTADTKLTYDINNVLGVVMATIQKLIQKIENLEVKING